MSEINDGRAVAVNGIDLGHLLNALVQLRWTIEDAAPDAAPELLYAISTTETALLTNEGRLSHEERDSFLEQLKTWEHVPAEGEGNLVERVAGLLSA